jgi:dihydropteroate synthase
VRVVPLAGRSEDAVRRALLSHGWDEELARTTSDGLESLAFHLTQLEPTTLEALVHSGSRLGLDIITGDDWALVAGPRARLSSLARPWTSPAPLVELATALGHALPSDDPVAWQTARGPIALDRPVLVGILNLTPDSFSDGGRYAAVDAALAQAERLMIDGASILDIGGESTRPGAEPVPEQEELARVLPVLDALATRHPAIPVSIDTVKSAVARAALDRGASIINDVSALRLDPAMGRLVAERGAGMILMHSRGEAGNLAGLEHADFPHGVVPGVIEELAWALGRARADGVQADRIVVDPGLGFGKTPEQSVELLRGLGALRVLGRPILVGPSRKRFLGELTGRPVHKRDDATAAACALAWEAGARLFRVHAPGPTRDALAVARAARPR